MEEVERYAGVVVAAVFSAITWLFTKRERQEKDVRITMRDTIAAQGERIEVLSDQLTDERRRATQAEQEVLRLRDDLRYLEIRLRRFEDKELT